MLTGMIVLVAAACSGQQHATRGTAASGTVGVSPGHSASLHLPGGLEVNVPAHTVTRVGTLSGTVIKAPATAPSGMALAGPVYDLHLTGTALRGNVKLHVPVPAPAGTGIAAGPNAALLVYYDAAAGRWQPVKATYSPATRTLTARSPHLSVWSVLRLDAGVALAGLKGALAFLGSTKIAQPSCPDSGQLAALGVKVTSDPGDLVKWCAGDTGAGAVIQVANNRGYALEADYMSDWTVRRLGILDAVSGQILASLPALSLRVGGPGVRTSIVPGGSEMEITPPAGASGVVLIVPSVEGIIFDALLYAANTLAMTFGDIPGVKQDAVTTGKAIALAFQDEECAAEMKAVAQNPDVSSPQAAGTIFRSFADVASGCLGGVWTAAYDLTGTLADFWVSAALWVADSIKIVIADSQALIDTALYWQGYHIYVQSTTPAGSPTAISGSYTLYRRAQSCINLSQGCAVTPMLIRITCEAQNCEIIRTNNTPGLLGAWTKPLPLTFDGTTWKAAGPEPNASSCHGQPVPGTSVTLTLQVVSGAVTNGAWKAQQLQGTYTVLGGPATCNNQTSSTGKYLVSTSPPPPAPSPTPSPTGSVG
jgi:hypothetical protein